MTVYVGWTRNTAVLDMDITDKGCGAGLIPCLECSGTGIWAFMEPEIPRHLCVTCKGSGTIFVSV
jgi:hypothetical protein